MAKRKPAKKPEPTTRPVAELAIMGLAYGDLAPAFRACGLDNPDVGATAKDLLRTLENMTDADFDNMRALLDMFQEQQLFVMVERARATGDTHKLKFAQLTYVLRIAFDIHLKRANT